MRFIKTSFLLITALLLAGCNAARENAPARNAAPSTTSQPASERAATSARAQRAEVPQTDGAQYQKTSAQGDVSLAQADQARAAQKAINERKIIRNADLTLEVNSPAEAQRRIISVAEAHGGFVVTSESKQRTVEDETQPSMTVQVVVRVPSDQFDAALGEIRGNSRVPQEKITGQDVTEEYFDLEARIKTKKALEAQFMEIMKQAHSVSDALEVQNQLGVVRTEIERLEGRQRYLENQASLSTITILLQTPTPLVNTTGFFAQVRRAFGNGVDIAAAITLFLIQAALALLPVALLIFLPLGLFVRYLLRRSRRLQLAQKLARDEP